VKDANPRPRKKKKGERLEDRGGELCLMDDKSMRKITEWFTEVDKDIVGIDDKSEIVEEGLVVVDREADDGLSSLRKDGQ
jgi:hypothetical protein